MKKNIIILNIAIVFIVITLVACGTDIQGDKFNTALDAGNIADTTDGLKFFAIADAGPDLATKVNTPVTINARNSNTGHPVGFVPEWRVINQPEGSSVVFSDIQDPEEWHLTAFSADTIGDYEIEIKCTSVNNVSVDTLTVFVREASVTNTPLMTFNLVPAKDGLGSVQEFEVGDDPSNPLVFEGAIAPLYGYYLMTTEVTQAQWETVMGTNPSAFQPGSTEIVYSDYTIMDCLTCPVENIPLEKVHEFILELNKLGEGTYRLPTVDELAYAARAGSTTAFANGEITESTGQSIDTADLDAVLDEIGWYYINATIAIDTANAQIIAAGLPIPIFPPSCPPGVAQKIANDWGFYDMHGSIRELAVAVNYYTTKELITNSEILLQDDLYGFGGSFASPAGECTSDSYDLYTMYTTNFTTTGIQTGLRLVRLP